MSQINRVPFGLQSLLGSKNFGVNPSELASSTIPVLDQTAFLGAELLQSSFGIRTASAVGNVEVTVPAGEAWLVRAAQNTFQTTATVFLAGSFGVYFPVQSGSTTIHNIGTMTRDNQAGPGTAWDTIKWETGFPLVVLPGTTFRSSIHTISPAVNCTHSISVLYHRLTI